MRNRISIGALLALLLLVGGCRGIESDNRPIHPNLNMDFQERYEEQEFNDFFENGMAMRPPVPGTVAKGFLRDDVRFYSGQTEEGQYVEEVPVPVTQALLERGQERYDIFCSVCHGRAGFGQGVIMEGGYGYTPAPTYHKETLRDTADGYLYEVITNGVRNMPGYAQQVPVADRWAIVAYIRALQRSQNAQRENIPPSVLARIEQTGSANMNAARNPESPAETGGGNAGAANESAENGGAENGGGAEAAPEEGTEEGGEANQTGAAPDEQEPSPADTAAPQPTAAAQDATGDTAAAPTASADTAAAGMDTTSQRTAVAEEANVTESTPEDEQQEGLAEGEEEGGRGEEEAGGAFFGSMFFIVVLVVLPIAALTTMLIVAFRKDRDH